ncbi:PREDICTED: uncharacterized protein LOC109237433 isoform X1 [Nicotiana attenuata]|uniref:Phosphatidylinositol 4-phosphate 5-kinase 8 n=1 Tax=Nicotiana attenuata TaxID=49451 RepID=A0A314LE63_NICAT|nr:PREDICTED: uncharacterized protein LOC109237433 isoform X1 [Nicotiana attenuata]OIT39945.1 phosphatidylinositol 4-phosphate 5-kinase 8 [Nicotiana attenuata]
MHQKTSEVQIGKESICCISSDFNPTAPLVSSSSSLHPKHPSNSHNFNSGPQHLIFSSSVSPSSSPGYQDHTAIQIFIDNDNNDAISPTPTTTPTTKTTPHKRPLLGVSSNNPSKSLIKTPTLSNSLHKYQFSSVKGQHPCRNLSNFHFYPCHIRLILFFSLLFFYFLVSRPKTSFFLDFLSSFAFSAALLFTLNLALPRFPSIRLFLAKSLLPIKVFSSKQVSKNALPVFWSIGSRPRIDKKVNTSGCYVQAYSNGDVFEGEFHKGKCSGSGVYYYYMSGRYEGDWVDGKYDGYGVETWARGSRYRGQYRQGLRHGFGVYRFYTGDVYAGEWSNGQSHGCGVHTCEDGSRYVGEFKWGVKHGLGHYHFRNGDTYAGEYFADKMHGFGVYCFANGHQYEGAWHEGRRQGLGMYTFRNGETQSGHWQNGVLHIPSTHNTSYPLSPLAVYHSKVLNAVQEARRAAERAYDVTKVDERANRAVAAANRAANAARVAAVKAVQKQMHHRRNSDDLPMFN